MPGIHHTNYHRLLCCDFYLHFTVPKTYSFLEVDDNHSNLGLLLEQLNDKDRNIAEKIMFHINRGRAKLSQEAVNLIKNLYTEY